MDEIKTNSTNDLVFLLVGNKNDLEIRREITFGEGENFAKDNNLIFLETSAKYFSNVDEVFSISAREILKKIESKVEKVEYFKLENKTP